VYIKERHANWKNGEASYRHILKREDRKLVCEKCSTVDARVLAVHHKDKNRKNNKPENLIWLCHNCHFLVHHFANESQGFIFSATSAA
jgi:RNase P subunit RPR2